jgi:hypothetical protein
MKWATAISRSTSFEDAVLECAEGVTRHLGPGPLSLTLAFVTPHFANYYPLLYGLVSRHLRCENQRTQDIPQLRITTPSSPRYGVFVICVQFY